MKKIITITLATLALTTFGCSGNQKSEYTEKRENAEAEGQKCLAEARTALDKNEYQSARSIIEQMRKEHSLALNAREEGILLLDSINLFEAEAQIKKVNKLLKDSAKNNKDSLQVEFDDLFQKTKFYKRKLEHDKKERKAH